MNIEIFIENEQDKVEIDENYENLIKTVAQKTLEYENVQKNIEISVVITDNDEIRILNREHRNIDRATDVLSFPMLEFSDGVMDDCAGDYFEDCLVLGDIVLSAEMAVLQAKEYGHSQRREVGFLVCHSMLHLLGYDHENDDEREIMRKKEEEILSLLKITR